MSRVVGDALLSRRAEDNWCVTCVEYPKGLALLQRTDPMTRVIIGDRASTLAGPDDPDAYSAAVCSPGGEVALVVHQSPPALLVGPTGCRAVPADGASSDCVRLAVGERLLLLSCAAYEKMPAVLADGIGTVPTELVRREPEILLLEIFRDFGYGAGAVIDRLDGATSDPGAP